MAASASGVLKTRSGSEFGLQAGGGFENAALALHLAQVFGAAAIGHVLAEDQDVRIAPHLLAQGGVDEVDHRHGRAMELRLGLERVGGGIDGFGIEVQQRGPRRGRLVAQGLLRGVVNFLVDFVGDALQHVPIEDALVDQKFGKCEDWVAGRFGFALGWRFVEALVVGERVGIGADDVGVNQRGTAAGPAICGGGAQGAVGGQKIGAVDFLPVQVGKAGDQSGNIAAGGLALDGDGNGVAVVLD